ncbi:MAG TPA: DUF177 domain-containing protein [Solirubrobacterales bacterium]|jgi:uncharacterized protein
MAKAPTTTIDLGRLGLSYGEGIRLDVPVRIEPLEMGGQSYALAPESFEAQLDVSRLSSGFAFRLRFPVRLEGSCTRCLEAAAVETEVDAREVDQQGAEDEELRSPYLAEDELDVGRWARDAVLLGIPAQVLCRPDCAGLCPGCGESLNGADPAAHEHDTGIDPRWEKLRDLELE